MGLLISVLGTGQIFHIAASRLTSHHLCEVHGTPAGQVSPPINVPHSSMKDGYSIPEYRLKTREGESNALQTIS